MNGNSTSNKRALEGEKELLESCRLRYDNIHDLEILHVPNN